MSTVFEGILVDLGAAPDRFLIDAKMSDWVVRRIGTLVAAFPSSGSRSEFEVEITEQAKRLSGSYGTALLIRFDTREGKRSSTVFRQGAISQVFSDVDELWVMLDDEGEPTEDGKRFTTAERDLLHANDPERYEFETAVNAVELGLKAMGIRPDVWLEIERLAG